MKFLIIQLSGLYHKINRELSKQFLNVSKQLINPNGGAKS